MIACNLSVLLAEKNLKITTVSQETGISRTTLTALANNHSGGIQFETLNTLCAYLDTTPENIFIFSPFDFFIEDISYLEEEGMDWLDDYYFDIRSLFNLKNKEYCTTISANVFLKNKLVGNKKVYTWDINLNLNEFITYGTADETDEKIKILNEKLNEKSKEKMILLSNTIKNLPTVLLTNIENYISNSILEKIKEITLKEKIEKYNRIITWNFIND